VRLLVEIEGKIIRILSEKKLIINVGLNATVKQGMIFEIYDEEGEPIIDPETKEVLGKLVNSKGRIVVETVMPKFSIVTTLKREIGPEFTSGISSFYTTIEEKLSINPEDIDPIKKTESATIKIGDKVRSVKR